jgi:hypothetical protein
MISPAIDKDSPNRNFRSLRPDMEVCSRKLFHSPTHQMKQQSVSSHNMSIMTKGGARIQQNRLDDIIEEGE